MIWKGRGNSWVELNGMSLEHSRVYDTQRLGEVTQDGLYGFNSLNDAAKIWPSHIHRNWVDVLSNAMGCRLFLS